MRLVLGILLLLFGLLMAAERLEGLAIDLPQEGSENSATWVRTIDGWERRDMWFTVGPAPVRLHPLVVASGEALLSLLALALFSSAPPTTSDG